MAPGARLNHAAVPCLYSPVRTRALVLLPVLPRPAVSGSRSLSRALARFVCCGLVAHAPREPMALPPHPLASAPTRHPPQSSAFVRAHCPCRRRPWEQIEEGAIKRCARLLPAFCRALSLRRSLTPTRLMLVRLQGILEDDLTGHKFDNKEYMTYFTLVYNMYVGPLGPRTPRGQRDSGSGSCCSGARRSRLTITQSNCTSGTRRRSAITSAVQCYQPCERRPASTC